MISDFTYPSTPHADTPRPNGTDEIIAQQRVTDLLETAFAEGSPAGKKGSTQKRDALHRHEPGHLPLTLTMILNEWPFC